MTLNVVDDVHSPLTCGLDTGSTFGLPDRPTTATFTI